MKDDATTIDFAAPRFIPVLTRHLPKIMEFFRLAITQDDLAVRDALYVAVDSAVADCFVDAATTFGLPEPLAPTDIKTVRTALASQLGVMALVPDAETNMLLALIFGGQYDLARTMMLGMVTAKHYR